MGEEEEGGGCQQDPLECQCDGEGGAEVWPASLAEFSGIDVCELQECLLALQSTCHLLSSRRLPSIGR